jgi:hypothetical protein
MTVLLCRTAAAVILAALAVQQYVLERRTGSAEAYQRHIRQIAQTAPLRVGAWIGRDVPVPAEAQVKLKPNMLISRLFTNVADGRTAGLLLEHCADAHDMAGHFPPHCFPANGWTAVASRPRDWSVDGLHLTGTEYTFALTDETAGVQKSMVVMNCLFRPGGLVLRDMDELARASALSGGEGVGAGQLQFYFDSQMPAGQRDAAAVELLRGYRELIEAILADVHADGAGVH